MPIVQDLHLPSVGEYINLFDLDFTRLGGTVLYYTHTCYSSSEIVWKGNTYTPIDITATGFEITSKGTLPRPSFKISNVKGELLTLVKTYNNCIGVKVTRWRTISKYLDSQVGADTSQFFPKDIYVIERKVKHNPLEIEFELSALVDFEGRKWPRRQILRDFCSHVYRRWDGVSAFIDKSTNPELITCPYTGSSYFDEEGVSTLLPEEDVCGKRLSDCEARFPSLPLPTRAFPGVARNRGAS